MPEITHLELLQIFLVVQTFLFALILFSFRNLRALSNKILSIYLLSSFLQFFFSLLELLKIYEGAIIGYYFIIPLMLCNAPVLYLYVRVLTIPDFKFNWLFGLHFLPAIILLLMNLFSYGNISHEVKIDIIMQKPLNLSDSDVFYLDIFSKVYFFTSKIFYNAQILLYSILMMFHLRKHRKNIYSYFSYTENISLSWLVVFIVAFVLISFYEMFLYEYSAGLYLIIINAYFLFLGLFGIKQTDIYIGRLKYYRIFSKTEVKNIKDTEIINDEKKKDIEESVDFVEFDKLTDTGVDNKIKIPRELMAEYVDKLEKFMEKEKPYLDNTLSLPDLASRLDIKRNILSLVINETYNKNFFNYINEYRVKEAERRLLNSDFDNLSIEGLAKSVGFNSKSVFNPAFKKLLGKTPAEFKKLNR